MAPGIQALSRGSADVEQRGEGLLQRISKAFSSSATKSNSLAVLKNGTHDQDKTDSKKRKRDRKVSEKLPKEQKRARKDGSASIDSKASSVVVAEKSLPSPWHISKPIGGRFILQDPVFAGQDHEFVSLVCP
jgi:hypothetical protein